MKNVKMSLANIQGKLSRKEMKDIMAGSGGGSGGDACATKKCKQPTGSSDCFTPFGGGDCKCWYGSKCE